MYSAITEFFFKKNVASYQLSSDICNSVGRSVIIYSAQSVSAADFCYMSNQSRRVTVALNWYKVVSEIRHLGISWSLLCSLILILLYRVSSTLCRVLA
jgi:hypothetical protein